MDEITLREECEICECKIKCGEELECCNCETLHCQGCSVETSDGWGEYLDESAFSVCSRCR